MAGDELTVTYSAGTVASIIVILLMEIAILGVLLRIILYELGFL